jgi:uncharacterized protein YndB with AHSA1/START domain
MSCNQKVANIQEETMSSTGASHAADTDRIVKTTILRAPRSRVWRALTQSSELGRWFGAELKDPFRPGARVQGPITIPGYQHLTMDVTIERMEPERLFSWRWQPGGDPNKHPDEPLTLVVFELEDVPEGTRLTVTESGFDSLAPSRRTTSYRENDAGWAGQLKNLTKYLA